MNQNELFAQGLCLQEPWKVVGSGWKQSEAEGRHLHVEIEVKPGSHMPCPCCQKMSPVYDHQIKRWRHMNMWQYMTILSAKVPRIECPEHGVKQVQVPWAREGSGFSLMFEALVMSLAREMPMKAIGELVGEHDTRLWRIVRHYVEDGHRGQDWSQVQTIGLDETATKRGHCYATVVVDIDVQKEKSARLLYMTPGRDAKCVESFAKAMPEHGARAEQVRKVAMDMSAPLQKGVNEQFPDAQKSFDRYHVMQLAGGACDEVRKELQRQGVDLGKGAHWALRGNEERLKPQQLQLRRDLCKKHKVLQRSMALREHLQMTWDFSSREIAQDHLKSWCSWALRSRLEPFKKLARSIKKHWEGILAYFPERLTSACVEATNHIIQSARRRARGFRNFENFKCICYWMAGQLDISLDSPYTHTI